MRGARAERGAKRRADEDARAFGNTTSVDFSSLSLCCRRTRSITFPLLIPRVFFLASRRVAAVSLAERVREERGVRDVGYAVRGDVSWGSRLNFVTVGIALKSFEGSKCVIVDEVRDCGRRSASMSSATASNFTRRSLFDAGPREGVDDGPAPRQAQAGVGRGRWAKGRDDERDAGREGCWVLRGGRSRGDRGQDVPCEGEVRPATTFISISLTSIVWLLNPTLTQTQVPRGPRRVRAAHRPGLLRSRHPHLRHRLSPPQQGRRPLLLHRLVPLRLHLR